MIRTLFAVLAALALGGCLDSGSDSGSIEFTTTVRGSVTGASGPVTVSLNGGESRTIPANGSFDFQTRLANGSSYAVSIVSKPASQTCVVTPGSGIVNLASISVSVTCSVNVHSIGGTLSGLVGTLVLRNGADVFTTGSDGPFVFDTPAAEGTSYAIVVDTQPATQTCTVSNGTGTVGADDVSVGVVCSTNTFQVRGAVTGLSGSVVLENNGADATTINGNGAFVFPTAVAQGSNYSVSVRTQPAIQTCTVGHGSGAVGAGDVTNVAVVCSTNSFTVGGIVSGLSGTVTLQNNGADTLAVSGNGAFTFPAPVAQASNYAVSVLTQPAGQNCTVTHGSGPMGTTNVADVDISCSNVTTTVSVSATGVIPVNNGSGTLTITNTGVYDAYNVRVTLPGGWTDVTQDASNCATLAPGASCSLSFTSTTPYVAQNLLAVTGDNLTAAPTTALAFSIDGFLVMSIESATVAKVVNTVSTSSPWSLNNVDTGAYSLTDGAANTAAAVAAQGSDAIGPSLCNDSTAGGTSIGTWYLPAICELIDLDPECPVGIANVARNLVYRGFDDINDFRWSSTQRIAGGSWIHVAYRWSPQYYRAVSNKNTLNGIQCMRTINY